MSNLEFAWPYAALGLLCLLPMWLFDKNHSSDKSFLISPQTRVLKNFIKTSVKPSLPRAINWLMIFTWMLLILALMRPQYVGDPLEMTRDGRNLMLVVDLSESMEAVDMHIRGQQVDRLTSAKSVLREFIDGRHGDRVGLVVFGSESFLHAPLSFDHPTIKQFLNDAQIGFAGPKTAIGDAIGLAVKKLVEQTDGEKTMVLLTDGQNNAGTLEPSKAADIAQKHGVKIYIVGLGSSRMVVDGFFGPTAVNPSISLDEAEPELREMATKTGGRYFRAREHDALSSIYKEIDQLEPTKSDPVMLILRKELFYWPLSLLLVIMIFRLMSKRLSFLRWSQNKISLGAQRTR